MIRVLPTRDLERVRSILTRPELYRWLADDFAPAARDFYPNTAPGVVYLLAFDGGELLGVVTTHAINGVLWEIHHAILPAAWGARAHAVGAAAETWVWANTNAQTLCGFTPACNVLALRFARKHGGREVGRIPKAYQRAGELWDLIVFAKTRPRAD